METSFGPFYTSFGFFRVIVFSPPSVVSSSAAVVPQEVESLRDALRPALAVIEASEPTSPIHQRML
ncbi:hypothetical protein GN244_ATG02140 [Phytophthora infestans]|uniref:Uncharacterized protein n=1 Tax=Phytophthora infestans TaxID=4787 RepID=A0A833WM77_PHYIN|nr:hypothetical protein GN244_ATG02140 [Phytophthora infestans]